MKITTFEDLNVYRRAKSLRAKVSIFTKTLPEIEKRRLSDQMTRSARSVTNQIAEGFGRFHYQENIQSCRIARGSLDELHDHFLIAHEEGFISDQELIKILNLKTEVRMLLNGYIRHLINSKKMS